MAKELLHRRGTTAQHAVFTGKSGELTVDTTKKTVVVHDNVTAGGVPLATESALTSHTGNSSNPHGVTKAQVGLSNVDNTADSSKNVLSATKLTTSRTLQTNLASTTAGTFDGSANITLGVTGTLPVANGGTGLSTITSGALLKGNGTGAIATATAGTDYATGPVIAGSTATTSAVGYKGTTNTAGYFYGGTATPTGTTRLNYSGQFYPTALNMTATSTTSVAATHYFVETGSDGFVRPKTLANVQAEIVTAAAITATGFKGGATGGGTDSVFYENDQVVTTSYSITAGKNAMSTGTVTINTGVTVTVPTGSRWVII